MRKEKDTKSIVQFHKNMALTLSDQLSAFTRVNFNIKKVELIQKRYNQFLMGIDHLTFVSLYKLNSRGMVMVINGDLVQCLTNKTMGGNGSYEENDILTFSETVMAKEISTWIQKYYNIHHLNYKFEREEKNAEHIHYFYPDEEVALLNFTAELDGVKIGNITLCQPTENLCLEPNPWLD
jgi:flagellar motor switch protein FliM